MAAGAVRVPGGRGRAGHGAPAGGERGLAPVACWPTCGQAWLALLRHVIGAAAPALDDRGPVLEGPAALFEISGLTRTDPVLLRYGRPGLMSAYDRKFTEDTVCPPFTYSYGARLRSLGGVDQLAWAAALLSARPHTKSGWISLTVPGEDPAAVPCLSALAFRRRDGLLHASAVFRSQNALTAYLNYLPLRDIQAGMAGRLGLPSGPLRVYIDVPHVYVADLPEVRAILQAVPPGTRRWRPRGVAALPGARAPARPQSWPPAG